MLYAIEGIDASGKKTQAEMLAAKLGPQASYWAFPQYRTRSGRIIGQLLRREIEVTSDDPLVTATVLQAMFTLNRYEALELLDMHRSKLEIDLILDRYLTSGLVYGQADGLPLRWLLDIHSGLPPADLWIFIDIPIEESFRRRPERRDKYEKDSALLTKVDALYRTLFSFPCLPGKWATVDGMGSVEDVHARIMREVEAFTT